jgi:hypothetical protein
MTVYLPDTFTGNDFITSKKSVKWKIKSKFA